MLDVKVIFFELSVNPDNAGVERNWRINNIDIGYLFSGVFITDPGQKIIRKNLAVFTKKKLERLQNYWRGRRPTPEVCAID
jgi:hypothetical protein